MSELTRYVLAVNTYLALEADPHHPVRPIAQRTEPVYLASEVDAALAAIVRLKYECRLKASTALGVASMLEAGSVEHADAIDECTIYKWVADQLAAVVTDTRAQPEAESA